MNKLILIVSISLLVTFTSIAQNIPTGEPLDEQMQELLDLAERRNMSVTELRNFALSLGYELNEIEELATQYETIMSSEENPDLQPLEMNQSLLSEGNGVEMGLDQYAPIFGQSFFSNSTPSIIPNVNISTPRDYIIGPSDEVDVEIYGASEQSHELVVDNEGNIIVPSLGPVLIGGLTTDAAIAKLKNALARIYSGIKGANPTVFVEVNIRGIRSITVNVVGEVETPGNVVIPAFSNVLNALNQAGGPTPKGSMRSIKIFRGSKQLATIDLYDFFLYGKNTADINLQDNDIILVDIYNSRVDIRGEVKRPMRYEITGNESISEIVSWAGGLLSRADSSSIILLRDQGASQFVKDLALNNEVIPLKDGDKIWVKEVEDYNSKRVQVEGAITVPGLYGWEEGMTIKELIAKAKGLAPDGDFSSATLFRRKSDLSPGLSSISLDISSDNTVLQPGDLLVIPSSLTLSGFQYIQVTGEVLNESSMPFYEGMTAWDAVVLSGGIKNSAEGGKIEIIRQDQEKRYNYEIIEEQISSYREFGGSLESIELEPFDHVFVRSSPGYQEEAIVLIEGEVLHPGSYSLTSPNTGISEIIKRAGGLTENAYSKGISLYRLGTNSQNVQSATEIELNRLEAIYKHLGKSQMNSVHKAQVQLIEERINTLREKLLLEERENRRLEADQQEVDPLVEEKEELTKPEYYSELFQRVGISYQEAIERPGSEADIVLLPGDRVVVPRRPETVLINGEVQYPTQARFLEKRAFKEYVSQAGGVTEAAKIGKSYIIYPNGEASRTKRFIFFRLYPKVEPGSEIVVPGGRTKFNIGTVSQVFGLLTSAASVVTTYILLQNLLDNQNNP